MEVVSQEGTAGFSRAAFRPGSPSLPQIGEARSPRGWDFESPREAGESK